MNKFLLKMKKKRDNKVKVPMTQDIKWWLTVFFIGVLGMMNEQVRPIAPVIIGLSLGAMMSISNKKSKLNKPKVEKK